MGNYTLAYLVVASFPNKIISFRW